MTDGIVIERLSKRFSSASAMAIENVDLSVKPGRISGIVGSNGAGKSTLIGVLTGIVRPTSGTAIVLGEDVRTSKGAYRQRVGYVTDQSFLPPGLTPRELLTYSRLTYSHWDEQRAAQLMQAFELPFDRGVRSLSKGMRVQLAFVLALSIRPRILLLDEPTSGLDVVVKRQVMQLLLQEAADGTAVVLATHNLDDLERVADDVTIMHRGHVVLQAATEDARQIVRRFQAVFPQGLPAELREQSEIVRIDEQGHVYTFIVTDRSDRILTVLRSNEPTFLEELDVDFEELFVQLMVKEGYAREQVPS